MHNSYLTVRSVECSPAAFHGREVLTRSGNSSASAHCVSAWVAGSSIRMSEMPFRGTAVVENKGNVVLCYPIEAFLAQKTRLVESFSPRSKNPTSSKDPNPFDTVI